MSTTPNCPECVPPLPMTLRQRRYDGASFWGCSNFPKCKKTRPHKTEIETSLPKVVAKKHDWSDKQKAVFDWVENGTGNLVVEANPGSGKTTLILESLNYTNKELDVALVAFNKKIALEMAQRSPEHVHVSTLHSLGLSSIRGYFGKVKVDNRKGWLLINAEIKEHVRKEPKYAMTIDEDGVAIKNLVSLCKATLREPTEDNVNFLADRFGIVTNGNGDGGWQHVVRAVKAIYQRSVTMTSVVDFDDMIFYPASGVVPIGKQFDFLFVDECQDLNVSQIELALKSVKPDGRVVAVGDRHQSIYGFRGADTDAIPNIIKALDATTLPLSVCYRCPTSHIELAQGFVPEVEPFEKNEVGIVSHLSFAEMLESLRPEDLVMCRTNAPLVAPAFELIRRGIKAIILGRDIGKGLISLTEKVSKRKKVSSLLDLLYEMTEYRDREVVKLLAAKKTGRAASLDDQVNTIVALASGADTIEELKIRIESVFADDAAGVVFSSVHKAKGTEADRTFILRPDLMPHPMATQSWEGQQEDNLQYVALTRAKKEMYFVWGEREDAGPYPDDYFGDWFRN